MSYLYFYLPCREQDWKKDFEDNWLRGDNWRGERGKKLHIAFFPVDHPELLNSHSIDAFRERKKKMFETFFLFSFDFHSRELNGRPFLLSSKIVDKISIMFAVVGKIGYTRIRGLSNNTCLLNLALSKISFLKPFNQSLKSKKVHVTL